MGYVNKKKNFHTLVPLLTGTDAELVVAGKLDDADYVHRMRVQARNWEWRTDCMCFGPVSEADKAWYFKTAWLLCCLRWPKDLAPRSWKR